MLIPPAVANELLVNVPGLGSLDAAHVDFVKIVSPNNTMPTPVGLHGLGNGEREAIKLATELGADYLLVDDRPARQAAARIGISTLGLLGVLVRAKETGIVLVVAPLLDRLMTEMNFRVSAELRQQVLRSVNES